MRRVSLKLWLLVLGALVAACTVPPAIPDLPAVDGASGNLLIIGWDGYDRTHLEAQLAAGELPELQALIGAGVYWPLQIGHHATDTKTGWTAIMTGVDPEALGIFQNSKSRPIPDGMTLFERLRADDPELVLGWYSAKLGNTGLGCQQDPAKVRQPFFNLCDDIDPVNVNPDNHLDNDKLARRAMAFIERNREGRFAAFVLFGMPDWAGHYCALDERGQNAGYFASVAATPGGGASGCAHLEPGEPDIFWGYGTDYWTGRIMDQLERLGLAEDTLVVVTSDHGFPKHGRGHTFRYPHVFMVASQPLVREGFGNVRAIAPSILRQLASPASEGGLR